MSRKNRFTKIEIKPDPKYHNILVAKFINRIMIGGKKTTAQGILYGALDIIKDKTKKDPIDIFDNAIKRVSPVLEVKAKRIGGGNYQIPFEVRGERKEKLASCWIIDAARKKKGNTMAERLAFELLSASKGEGGAYKKKEDTHRMAEANKAFAHYARYN